jgi:hypothetical protein
MAKAASPKPPCNKPNGSQIRAVGGPVSRPWREGTLTRAAELEALSAWVQASQCPSQEDSEVLVKAICFHLDAAREAAEGPKPAAARQAAEAPKPPKKRFRMLRMLRMPHMPHTASRLQRAMSNLDAAEVELLNFAPPRYLLGQMPGMLNHVQRHLPHTDPRRQEFERLAQRLGVKDSDHPLVKKTTEPKSVERRELIFVERITRILLVERQTQAEKIIERERGKIVTVVRGASSEALREQIRLHSFRNILIATIAALFLLASGVAVFGWFFPMSVPLCFQPSLESGETVIVCPTAFSNRIPPEAQPGPVLVYRISEAVRPWDHLTVELVGLAAAAVVATIRIRNIRGSSEAPNLPVLLALLKLPMGALTAFLGLLLVRGGFVPGLSALDSPAQILSWALVFGFAQQLFTRLVDQQGQTVLNNVRTADTTPSESRPRPS